MEEGEASQENLALLQSDVDKLRAQLKALEDERHQLINRCSQLQSAEDRKVKNWKLISEATKFFGITKLLITHSSACNFPALD